MIVTYIHSSNPEDEFRVQVRCQSIVDAINRIGWHGANLLDLNSFIQNTPVAHKLCSESDLLVVHRYLYGPVLRVVEYWKARDKKIIVDFDQAINYLTPDIPGHSFWLEGCDREDHTNGNLHVEGENDQIPLEEFKWGLGLIDAAIVSSTQLVIDWSRFVDVYEIPDYLNTDQYPASKQNHEDEIWLGLAKGTRVSTLKNSGLERALENVSRKCPKLKLVFFDTEDAVRLMNVHPSQKMINSSGSFDEWAEILLKLDIGLVPVYGDYDLRLGRMNLLEFMISKTPWIASSQPAFHELSRFGRLIENSADSWETAILKAVDNIDTLRKKAMGEPFLFALSQDINENIDKVLSLFTSILNQAC